MKTQNLKVEQMYKAVSTFRDLGDGRNYKKVLLGNTDDARTATFYFFGHISHNWPSWKQIAIKVDNHIETFDISTQTINGRPAYFYLWNELTADLWNRQNDRGKLLRWTETAQPEELTVVSELVRELTGSEWLIHNYPQYPQLGRLNRGRLQLEIHKLSASQLRMLNNMIEVSAKRNPPLLSMAA